MRYYFLFLLQLFAILVNAQVERKKAISVKTDVAPRIDGILNEALWDNAKAITDFNQFLPIYNEKPSFATEVKIIYDDQAIYVGALMTDPYPDSIPMQLGNRDDENMNVDYFGVEFDTYNNQLDAYTFIVTAAGVQIDYRESDETYDGVWLSETNRVSGGWVVEMKIPYSALRFPTASYQIWGLEILRSVRRYREFDHWALEKPGAENSLVYWGELYGIESIEPPVRLSVTPYLAMAAEHYPSATNRNVSTSFGGGMDLKYGLNESFTFDMTLLPDFSQVQSDNKVKNLTAFETIYTEQRPFFKEAVDLFEKGDLFYSRRIGRTPENFLQDSGLLVKGEKIIKNPVQQRLLNAIKLSGRSQRGLATGILNAVTGNTYAIIEDSAGNRRRILTDPATNYNMLVFAQALKNNSEVFISNSNLIRAKGYGDANVTAAGIKLNDKTNTYILNINGGLSQNYKPADSNDSKRPAELGYKVYAGIGKTNGNFQFTLVKGAMNSSYDANAMGITLYNNYHLNYATIMYNIYKPWWILRELNNTLLLQNENNFTTRKVQKASLELKSFGTSLKYLSMWFNARYEFLETFDYYEPRVAGRYYLAPKFLSGDIGISSDYRKTFALDAVINASFAKRDTTREAGISLHPIFRVNNHFIFDYIFAYNNIFHQLGYAALSGPENRSVVFGKREVTTVINTISGKYLFKNNLSLNLNTRHYWAKGKYDSYYTLCQDGSLEPNNIYAGNHDFNFNVFTVDMIFSWIFAPGSSMSMVWKNSITPDEDYPVSNFFSNLRNTFDSPQRNIFSFKILYYLDYLQVKKRHN